MIAAIGSLMLALCALPEAIKTFKQKSCSLGWGMLLLWLFGELFLVVFAIQTKQYVLLINYCANIAFLSPMVYYKIRGRNETSTK
jgi:uncharacterized protein with PQ loop repeat